MEFLLLFTTVAMVAVNADVYFQFPPGSNNRLDGRRREVERNNRLFDSQNNNRGGYNVGSGSTHFYVGSILPIEWTNQHQCGGNAGGKNPNGPHAQNSNCELTLQYMCDDQLRDGLQQQRIPERRKDCENSNCNTDQRFGMHEDIDYYERCKRRERNQGLFTADQKLKKTDARATRQNPDGTRRGYECPEERDYYPYWASSPWRDIVVMTTDTKRCKYYKEGSQNVNEKWECTPPEDITKDGSTPINKEDCEALGSITGEKGVWTPVKPHGIPEPECIDAPYSRDNHLGNGVQGVGGFANTFNWTIPDDPTMQGKSVACALRIRYNISTSDFDGWKTYSKENGDPTKVDIGNLVGLADSEAAARGYVFKGNPNVQPFKDSGDKFTLQLAVNTAQYFRTFEDRTHMFSVRGRPDHIPDDAKIHNLGVRGKRGNIVQTYPATEYDFVPNRLEILKGHYIHIQWDGSNDNPNNNAGQGKAGTDRSNIVELTDKNFPQGQSGFAPLTDTTFGDWGNSYPKYLDKIRFLGLTSKDDFDTLSFLARLGTGDELNHDGTYVNLPPFQCLKRGTYYYLCTRNNNFTNRSQKAVIIVK